MKYRVDWRLIIIIIIGAALRLYNLGAESLWFDEIESIDIATRDLSSLFSQSHLSPLYFFLLRCWIRIFGLSEPLLRSLSVIFSLGCIFLVYELARVLFNRRTALISSFIVSISVFHIFYAQEIRNYSLFCFLSLLSMLLFVMMAKKQFNVSRKTYFYYALATVLLLYTHLWSVLVVAAQNVYFFMQKAQKKKWLFTQMVIFLIFLIWLVPFIVYFSTSGEYVRDCVSWIPRVSFSSFADVFKTFSYGGPNYGGFPCYIEPQETGTSIEVSKYLLYIFGMLCIVGLVTAGKRGLSESFLLIVWLCIPMLALALLSFVCFPVFVIRYMISSSIAYCILVARGLDKIKSRFFQAAVIICVVLLAFPSLWFYYRHDIKISWDEVFDYLKENKKDNDVVVIGRCDQVTMFDYLQIKDSGMPRRFKSEIRKDLGIKIFDGEYVYYYKGQDKIVGIRNAHQLKRIVEKGAIKENKDIWLILSRWIESTGNPQAIRNYLGSFCRLKKEEHFEDVDIFHYVQDVDRSNN